jgi:hypothetical protein
VQCFAFGAWLARTLAPPFPWFDVKALAGNLSPRKPGSWQQFFQSFYPGLARIKPVYAGKGPLFDVEKSDNKRT